MIKQWIKSKLERRLEAAEKKNLGLLDETKELKAQFSERQDEPEIPDMPVFNEILTQIGVSIVSSLICFIIIVAIINIYGEIKGTTNCAYCHGTITEDADYVCMKDGRRMHTGCYMRAIREGNFDEDADER